MPHDYKTEDMEEQYREQLNKEAEELAKDRNISVDEARQEIEDEVKKGLWE